MKVAGLVLLILFMLFMIGRTFVLGSASADGKGLTREDDPMAFWAGATALILGALVLTYLLLREIGAV